MATKPVVCSITMNFRELPVIERGTFRLLGDDDIPDDLRNYLNSHIFGFIQLPITIPSYTVDVYNYEDRPGGTIDIDVTVRVPVNTTTQNIEQFIDEIFAKDINRNIFTPDYPITRGPIMQGGKRCSKRVKQKSKGKSKRKSKGKSKRKLKR